MNKGAQKVQAIAKSSGDNLIFRGRILFCLKDVGANMQKSAMKEFQDKTLTFVQSGGNSFSKIYGSNGTDDVSNISFAAFPYLSKKFYRQLQVCPAFPARACSS